MAKNQQANRPSHLNQSNRSRPDLRRGTSFRLEKSAGGDSLDLYVYGPIGECGWSTGVTAAEVVRQLTDAGPADTINVHINSEGGAAYDAITIYNTLCANPAKVIVEIEGMAASAASVLAMSGDEIRMAENAIMMIHPAQGYTYGDAAEMRKTADIMDKLDGQIANTYAKRTGGSADDFLAAMKEETWYTAEEALAAKLCTSITPSKTDAVAVVDRKILNKISRRPDKVAAIFKARNEDDGDGDGSGDGNGGGDGDDSGSTPASKFHVGDRVQVSGDPHNDGEDRGSITGVTTEPCYCVRFDDMDADSKFYAESELAEELEEADDPDGDGDGDGMDNSAKWTPRAVAVRMRLIELDLEE